MMKNAPLISKMNNEQIKIIFLDIDDVLNCSRTAYADYGYNTARTIDSENKSFNLKDLEAFDWTAIKMLQRLQKDNEDINFVLSSTWRKYIKYSRLAQILNLRIIHKTPHGNEFISRGHEIQSWLDTQVNKPENYVILDDDCDMLKSQLPHFVKVERHNGLTFQNLQQICNIFKTELIK